MFEECLPSLIWDCKSMLMLCEQDKIGEDGVLEIFTIELCHEAISLDTIVASWHLICILGLLS